jgi:hypothetical protein
VQDNQVQPRVAIGSKTNSRPDVAVGSSAPTVPKQKSLKDLQWRKQKPPKRMSGDQSQQPPGKKPKVQKKAGAKRQQVDTKKVASEAENQSQQPWWPEPAPADGGVAMDMIDDDVKGGQWSWPQALSSHPRDAWRR